MRFISLIAAFTCALATPAAAAPVVYYLESENYNSVSNHTTCPVGTCKFYNTTMKLSGTITLVAPLDPDLDVQVDDVGLQVDDFSFSDGVNQYVYDANHVITAFRVSTDGTGALTDFEIKINRVGSAPYDENSATLLSARVGSILINGSQDIVAINHNAVCLTRGDFSDAAWPIGAGCSSENPSAPGASSASAPSVTLSLTPPPAPIPTLSEWVTILLASLLAGVAAIRIRKRQAAA